jgi:hypothetical protein
MPSLLTTGEKAELEAIREDGFLTWARPFVWFKTPQTIIIDSNTNYNFSYGIQPEGVGNTDYVSYDIQSGIFSGCIQYDNRLNQIFSNPQGSRNENFRITMDKTIVRLKVHKEDYDNFLKDTQSLTLDSKQYTIVDPPRPHGLFSPKYYTLYLEAQN